MTQRRRLDAYLAEQAVAGGRRLPRRVKVTAVGETADGLRRSPSAIVRSAAACSSAPTASTASRPGARPRRRSDARRRARGQPRRRPGRTRTATAAVRSSSSESCRAATAGSSRRATTSTSESAAGSARGRLCAITCASSATRTASSVTSLDDVRGYRLPLRSPDAAARPRPGSPSSATPPVWSIRSPATACSRPSSRRGSPPRPRSTCSSGRAAGLEPYDRRLRRAARRTCCGLVGREGGVRPLPAARVHPFATALRLAGRSSGSCAAI